jgi:thioredoxin reductase
MLDVIVIGGGPAGLSAALMLGRCRRRVLVCDAGTPRNAASGALHGYLTRDGCPPQELLAEGRRELAQYGIEQVSGRVAAVHRSGSGFDVRLEDGRRFSSRRILIATGVQDRLPPVDGADACYGVSLFHCPYCDGWERRGQRLAVYGRGQAGAALSLALQTWTDDLLLLTDGPGRLAPAARERLTKRGIAIDQRRIRAFRHEGGVLHAVTFAQGPELERDGVFFTTGQHQQAGFAQELGCEFNRKGTVRTDRYGQTCVPGVFVVGDASRDVQFVVVAAAEGAKAAVAINKQFQAESGQGVPEE